MFVTADLSTTQLTGNILVDSLLFETAFVPDIRITYVLEGETGDGPFGGETWAAIGARAAFAAAAATWAAVARVTFIEAAGPYNGFGSIDAYDWIESFEVLDDNVYGQHELPHEGTLLGNFNSEGNIFTAANLKRGGDGFSTFVHEIGHGLGLLHPHNDEEDAPGDVHFPGVEDSFDLGSNTLNQGVYSVMTYNDGYVEVGLSNTSAYGWAMGPMALDIAAIQHIYGPNLATATGNDSYLLPSVNAEGTGWIAIWDAGGTDTISAAGAAFDAIIDLRAATLRDEPGGGGFVSRVTGILGGVTIANGVVIENAIGGNGNDRIHGNAAANRIDGGAGHDTVDYSGVSAPLVIDLAAGTASGGAEAATGVGIDALVSIESAIGGSGADRLVAGSPVVVDAAALDLVKRAGDAISTRQTALVLDGHFAQRTDDARIPGPAGLASVTVHAAGAGTLDFYTFTAPASGRIFIDIDNSFAADLLVRLLDADGNTIAVNDDGEIIDPGSANVLDPYLSTEGLVPGRTYVIEVSEFGGQPVPRWASYDLRVAMIAATQPSGTVLRGATLDGGAGNDVLVGSTGNDWLIGGSGDDTIEGRGGDDAIDGGDGVDIAVFAGLSTNYQVTTGADGTLRISGGVEGADRVAGVEGFRFSNGLFRWDATSARLVAQGSAPVVDAAQAIVVAEDGSTALTVRATDPENDPLTWVVSTMPAHGLVTGGVNGAFVYTPFANFSGSDRFVVAVRDAGTATSLQTVTVTVTEVNDLPLLAASAQSLVTSVSTPREFTVAASDADGDPLSMTAGAPAHGQVTALGQGLFTYAPTPGYVGSDAFAVTVSDGRGGTVVQQIDVAVRAPTAALPGFSAYLADGFVGGLGGSGRVTGSNRVQDLTLLDRPGAIVLDGSFNRGGDVIRMTGAATDYRITRTGSTAVLVDGDSSYSIPVGPAGTLLVFADGSLTLGFDAASTMRVGTQVVTANAQTILDVPQTGVIAPTVDSGATAKIYLDAGGRVEVAGNAFVVGTSGSEEVSWRSGDLTLDGSFNRGGDVLRLGQSAQQFDAYRSGSSVILVNGADQIAIPLGAVGMAIDFSGEVRTARIDPLTSQFFIGSQLIDAAAADPEPLVSIASLEFAVTAPSGAFAISVDGNYTF